VNWNQCFCQLIINHYEKVSGKKSQIKWNYNEKNKKENEFLEQLKKIPIIPSVLATW